MISKSSDQIHVSTHSTQNKKLFLFFGKVTIESQREPSRCMYSKTKRNSINFHRLTASSNFKMAWQRILMQIIIQGFQIFPRGFMQAAQGFFNCYRRIFTNSDFETFFKNLNFPEIANLCTFLLFLDIFT